MLLSPPPPILGDHTPNFLPDCPLINFFPAKVTSCVYRYGKSHLLLCHYAFNNAHPGIWRAHAKFQPSLLKCLAMMPRHVHIQTYIHTYQPKYILICVCRFNSYHHSELKKKKNLFHFIYGERCSQEGSHPCYSQSEVVYAYHYFFCMLLQGFVWSKYHFFPLF